MWAKKKYGDVVEFDLGLKQFTYVLDPELLRKLYSWNPKEVSFEAGILDFVSHILDDKLYSDPNFNKKIPSIVKQGINTPKQLEIFFTTIKEETDKIVNEWTSSTEKLELFHEASKFMLRTAIRIILGEVIYNKYRDELVEDFRTLEIDGFAALTMIIPYLPFGKPKKVQEARKRVSKIVTDFLKNDAENHAQTTTTPEYVTNMIINGHTKDVGQDVISGHLMGMIFAFHANTAGTFAWALLRLANHKEAREKVIKEYQDNIAKGVSTFDINNFPYLKAVILETNRRYGAFMTLRKTVADTQIGDYMIPKDKTVVLSAWTIGNNPDLVDNPEEWRPERYQTQEKYMPYHFVFGTGLHPCMGEKIAYTIMINAIPRMFIDYKFTPLQEGFPAIDWARGGYLFAKEPYYVSIKKN